MEQKLDRHAINRLYNAVDQFILKLVDFNKVIVHADSGKVISLQQALKLGIVDKVVPLAELATNIKRDILRLFGSMVISQSSKI